MTSHAMLTVDRSTELLPFLFTCHPDVKRTKVRQWLKHGLVRVNGESVARTNHVLQVGDRVSIESAKHSGPAAKLTRGLRLVFEDGWLLVVEKPANLLSIASAGEREKTAYACVTDYVRGGNPRARSRVWIVHRLDRETSGLMVFAKTPLVKQALQDNWSSAEKRYLAIVEGRPPQQSGVLRSHVDESRPHKVVSDEAPGEGMREAITEYRVLKQSDDLFLLELRLRTGRRHQIRVQLADAGCPVVGDRKYQARTNPARRLALHASLLRFRHPHTGQQLTFQSRLPRVLARLV